MQKEDQKELARVRSARKWLSRAEERIESGDSIQGKMHVLLAEAEISLFRKKHPFIFLSTSWIISGLFQVSRLTHRRPYEKLAKAIWITTVPLPCRSFPNGTGCRSSCWSPVLRCGAS